jgi:hypothetical protein
MKAVGKQGKERFKRDWARSSGRGKWEDQELVEPIDTASGGRVVCVVDIAFAIFNTRPARERRGEGEGEESVDQALQLREHMA